MSAGMVDMVTKNGLDHQQFLTFTLSDQEFGIEILSVQEIRNFTTVTPIPNSPSDVQGVINLRGAVVPIIDLKMALGIGGATQDKFAVIIVVNVASKAIGLTVDAVSDVVDVKPDDIVQTPEMLTQGGRNVVQGIAKSDQRLISILDLNCLLHNETTVPGLN